MSAVKPVPEGYRSVTPCLVLKGAAEAIDFYVRAFGAKEISRMPMPDGRVGHAEIKIGDSMIMLSDEFPEMNVRSPLTIGATGSGVFLYVDNVDEVFERAVGAGATVVMPVADMFWGDRYGKITDPFGHQWNLATHTEDLSEAEILERGAKAMSKESCTES